jgi:cytochrome c-type biogenesis protein CcmH/NrfG
MHQNEEAAKLLQEVIRQDPSHADAYYQLGKLQLESGDSANAISSLEKSAQLSPDSDYIHYQLALAYRRASRADDAAREMTLYQSLKERRRGSHEPAQPN